MTTRGIGATLALVWVVGVMTAVSASAVDAQTSDSATRRATPTPVIAQSETGGGAVATRADLQAIVARGGPDAANARERLDNGDFRIGDRIALFVQGEAALTDTVAVRAGQTLHLTNLPDISLHGVLHSELQSYLTHELSRYLRNPVIRAVPLVRVAVLGPVGRPGFYTAPADELVSDLVMQAGGPTASANLDKTVVRRAQVVVRTGPQVHNALHNGATLDQLDVRPGDEVVVGEKPPSGHFAQVLGIVSGVIGIAVGLVLVLRH